MRTSVISLFFLVLFTVASPSAFAGQDIPPGTNDDPSVGGAPLINIAPDPCDGASSADECMDAASDQHRCTAGKDAGQMCHAVKWWGTEMDCTVVAKSALCWCNPVTKKSGGYCAYF